MIVKTHATSKLTGNKLSIPGTNTKQIGDILADSLLIVPYRLNGVWVSLGAYIQASAIYRRHREELLALNSIVISGHSLGAGNACILSLLLRNDKWYHPITLDCKGGLKVLGRRASWIVGVYCTVKWQVRHRDPIPHIPLWYAPGNDTEKTGDKRRHWFDWSMSEHMGYWG